MITLKQSMIKTLLVTAFFALILGLGLSGTVYYIKQNQKSRQSLSTVVPTLNPQTDNLSPTNTPDQPNSTLPLSLTITSHQNYDLVSTAKITLTGTTTPNSILVLTTPSQNYNFSADDTGKFSQAITLDSGFNTLHLKAISPDNQETELTYYLTFSTAKI